MSSYANGRKPHRHVTQAQIVEALAEVGGSAVLDDVAEHFDVSTMTARRNLDGLVAQGRARVLCGPGPREYALNTTTRLVLTIAGDAGHAELAGRLLEHRGWHIENIEAGTVVATIGLTENEAGALVAGFDTAFDRPVRLELAPA